MGLLTIENAVVLDGAVAAPVAHGGQAMINNCFGPGPVGQHNRLQRGEPVQSASGNLALRPTDRQPDGYKMSVAGKAHVNALDRVPELHEGRVQIEVDARWNAADQLQIR